MEGAHIWYEYHPISTSYVKQEITPDNELPVDVTNTSYYNEIIYYVTAFFKKDGEIVWAQQKDTLGNTGQDMKPGETRTVKYWLNSVKADYDAIDIQINKSSGSSFGGN